MKITRSYTIEHDLLAKIEEIAKWYYMGNNSLTVNILLEKGIKEWEDEKEWLNERIINTNPRNTI